MRNRDPKDNPNSIGRLLLAGGHCTPEDIERALKHADELMGEYMVRQGIISADTLEAILAHQRAASKGNGAILSYAKLAVQRSRQMKTHFDTLDLAIENLK